MHVGTGRKLCLAESSNINGPPWDIGVYKILDIQLTTTVSNIHESQLETAWDYRSC